MTFKKIYSQYQHIIWPAATCLSSIIILVFVIIPQLMTYFNIKTQIFDLQNRTGILDAKAAELGNIDEIAAQKDLQVVFTVLPTDQDVLQAMQILQNSIKESGLELTNTSFSSSKQKTEKESFQLNITVFGQISSLRSFLIKLQDSSRIFQVDSIAVQFLKSKSGIEAEMPITVFYQRPPKALGAIDQKVPTLSESEKQLLERLENIISQQAQPVSTFSATIPEINVPLGKVNPFE